jgi:hypothetical protein
MKKIQIDKKLNNNFLTLDIETRLINNIITPYCISIFNGTKATSFYLSVNKNVNEMLLSCIRTLIKSTHDSYKIYVHNLSSFDGIFLLRILSNIPGAKLNPVIKDGKMINLAISWKKTENSLKSYKIDFRDSLLLLPVSLRKLAKAFNVEEKGNFPYSFLNNYNIKLDYVGDVPSINFFSNITEEIYNDYKSNYNHNWSLKEETIKYCEQDCKTLWKIIDKFNELIFDKYSLNVHRCFATRHSPH